jgi:hypothetical protein
MYMIKMQDKSWSILCNLTPTTTWKNFTYIGRTKLDNYVLIYNPQLNP